MWPIVGHPADIMDQAMQDLQQRGDGHNTTFERLDIIENVQGKNNFE